MNEARSCISILSDGDVVVLGLEGEIDIYTATDFKAAVVGAIESGRRRMVIDLTEASFIDSAGLSVLLSAERRLRPLGGSLAVACSPRTRRVVEMTGLGDAFVLCSTRDEAVLAASSDPGSLETTGEPSEQ
jgi:anti-sigma B factor antagonist